MKNLLQSDKITAAKANLEKMLETIGPYLPKPDVRPREKAPSWTLEGSDLRQKPPCGKRKGVSMSPFGC